MRDSKGPVNRRKLFREGFNFLGKVALEFNDAVQSDPEDEWNPLEPMRGLLRPPGAVAEEKFLGLCTKCDDCIKACPENTLFRAPETEGKAEGTPTFKPARKPCFLCTDLYCINACQTGALVMVDDISELDMGKARLTPAKCKAYKKQHCDYCVERCPLKGKAIIMIGGVPLVRAPECVGCGLCEYHCVQEAHRHAIITLARTI